MMLGIFRFFKYTLTTLLVLIAVLYALGYLLLSIPQIQQRVKNRGEIELRKILKTDVQIDRITIQPFNKIALHDFYLCDLKGDTLLYSNKLAAGFDFWPLLKGRLVFSNIQFFGFRIALQKETPDAPLNARFVIDAFKKDSARTDTNIDLKIKSVLIRRGSLAYDVLSEPHKPEGVFDPNHIAINSLLSTLSLKAFTSDTVNLQLKRLSGEEKSGLSLNRLAFKVAANRSLTEVNNFELRLPNSQIVIDSLAIHYGRADSLHQFSDSTTIYLNMVNSEVQPADLAALSPALRKIELPVSVDMRLEGSPNDLDVKFLRFKYDNSILLNAEGRIKKIFQPESCYLSTDIRDLYLSSAGIASLTEPFMAQLKSPLIQNIGYVRFTGNIEGYLNNLSIGGQFRTPLGELKVQLVTEQKTNLTYTGKLSAEKFKLGKLIGGNNPLDQLSLNLEVAGQKVTGQGPVAKIVGSISQFDFKGYTYDRIDLDGTLSKGRYDGQLRVDDDNGLLVASGVVDLESKIPTFHFQLSGENIRLHELKLITRYPDSRFSFAVNADFTGETLDKSNGKIALSDVAFDYNENQFRLDSLLLTANNDSLPQSITLSSDLLNGAIEGSYSFKALPRALNKMLKSVLPSLVEVPEISAKSSLPTINNFRFWFSVDHTQQLSETLELPIRVGENGYLSGYFDEEKNQFRIETDIPQAQINNSILENISVVAEKKEDNMWLRAGVNMLNKRRQYILLALNAEAQADSVNMTLNWSNLASSTFSGILSTTTHLYKPEKSKSVSALVDITPSSIIINDTIWNMSPAKIRIDSSRVDVRNFEVRHQSQFLKIDGRSSASPDDYIDLRLNDINLDYIFETVNIEHVTFGGRATGDFEISGLTEAPLLTTNNFRVTNFSYNDVTLGNLKLKSSWDNQEKGIAMEGVIAQPDYPDTKISGHIYPTKEKNGLALHFNTHHLNAAFLRPFVDKILRNVSGYVYGEIDFYGQFSALNVVGDAYLQNLNFDIDYINTSYTINDSLHLREDGLYFDRLRLTDHRNQSASVSGQLRYKNFRDLSYDIAINDVDNLTVFNMTEYQNPVYYGTVYGTGVGTIKGDVDYTNIDVNMQIDAGSTFSYVLSDNQTAADYPFITFVDRRALYNQAEESKSNTNQNDPYLPPFAEQPHNLRVNLQMDVSRDGTVYFILDPATGDMIKANGTGNLRLEYSPFEEMKLFGTYTLERGNYNFSLQDLITRDFSIKQGSSVSFNGSPLSADLNIQASYSVTANLADLDESFSEDKELTRTNVPVQTVLHISGDLQRPDLKFDLALPSLSQEVERKVRSVVNTDEMMNRQIIYLLALGRFYTPDYMNMGQTRNNELASMASATLSSQLNNILGQISDKWNIGTQIRSDKGDFSDVEFELALSSQLLNNRLLFNGNLGYRDNMATNNTFIGDFDLEYLLNRSGNLRLKAYNHYNDRNYYIKSALTTQGVGFVFKRDFTSISDLFGIDARRKKKSATLLDKKLPTLKSDSISGSTLDILESDTLADPK